VHRFIEDLVPRPPGVFGFVAPETRDDIRPLDTPLQPMGDGDEQLVTAVVAKAIIDVFEAVKIYEEDGKRITVESPGTLEDHFQAVREQRAIGQPRQRIMKGDLT
jgi:hypothetical protein